jgi:hypothetical protein
VKRALAIGALLLAAACDGGAGSIDTLPPVTRAHPGGGSYGAIQYVSLASEEAAIVYWELEGAPPPPGHPSAGVAENPAYWIRIGPGTTTLRFHSVDRAGNVEATRSETYVVEVPTP